MCGRDSRRSQQPMRTLGPVAPAKWGMIALARYLLLSHDHWVARPE